MIRATKYVYRNEQVALVQLTDARYAEVTPDLELAAFGAACAMGVKRYFIMNRNPYLQPKLDELLDQLKPFAVSDMIPFFERTLAQRNDRLHGGASIQI